MESDIIPAPAITIQLNEEDEEDLLGGGWLNDGHFAVVNALLEAKAKWPGKYPNHNGRIFQK